jgi:hypothetical protein
MSQLYRPKSVVTFAFASGATTSTVKGSEEVYASLQGISGCAFVFDATSTRTRLRSSHRSLVTLDLP